MSLLTEMVPDASGAGVENGASADDFKTLREKVFGNKRKGGKVKTVAPEVDVTEKELQELFASENWEEIAALYFNARYAMTGYDDFLLTNAQKKTLGLTLGKSMKMLLKIDPGYIALIIFSINFGGIIAQKEVTYRSAKKAYEREHAGKQPS